jgi:hypothetical protein
MRFDRYSFMRRWSRKSAAAAPYRHTFRDAARRTSHNPFFERTSRVSRKKKLLVAAGAVCLAGSAGLLLFHPFFSIRVQTIAIDGITRIDENEFRSTVLGIIAHRAFGIFPRNTYFLVSVDELADILPERFPIENIRIEKTFPDGLNITLTETPSTIIYDAGSQYGYVGPAGTIVENLRPPVDEQWVAVSMIPPTTTTGTPAIAYAPPIRAMQRAWGDYPIVYDVRHGAGAAIGTQVFTEDMVKSILSWHKLITRQTDIPLAYIRLENDLGDAVIETGEGWEIRTRLDAVETERQFKKLSVVLKDIPDRTALRYVDVRFRDRAFWQ